MTACAWTGRQNDGRGLVDWCLLPHRNAGDLDRTCRQAGDKKKRSADGQPASGSDAKKAKSVDGGLAAGVGDAVDTTDASAAAPANGDAQASGSAEAGDKGEDAKAAENSDDELLETGAGDDGVQNMVLAQYDKVCALHMGPSVCEQCCNLVKTRSNEACSALFVLHFSCRKTRLTSTSGRHPRVQSGSARSSTPASEPDMLRVLK